MCFAYTNEIPKSVEELEKLSTDASVLSFSNSSTLFGISFV